MEYCAWGAAVMLNLIFGFYSKHTVAMHTHTLSLSLPLSLSLSRSLTLLQQAYSGHAFAAVNLLAGTLFYRFGVYGCMV